MTTPSPGLSDHAFVERLKHTLERLYNSLIDVEMMRKGKPYVLDGEKIRSVGELSAEVWELAKGGRLLEIEGLENPENWRRPFRNVVSEAGRGHTEVLGRLQDYLDELNVLCDQQSELKDAEPAEKGEATAKASPDNPRKSKGQMVNGACWRSSKRTPRACYGRQRNGRGHSNAVVALWSQPTLGKRFAVRRGRVAASSAPCARGTRTTTDSEHSVQDSERRQRNPKKLSRAVFQAGKRPFCIPFAPFLARPGVDIPSE